VLVRDRTKKAFINIAVRGNEDTISLSRKFDLCEIQVVRLDGTNGKKNGGVAKRVRARVDSALSGFQDSDIILSALPARDK
jgi:hypothetical protein